VQGRVLGLGLNDSLIGLETADDWDLREHLLDVGNDPYRAVAGYRLGWYDSASKTLP